jgi:hypothetical protein
MQTSSAQLTLQAASPSMYSSLNVTGDADLGGTLNLDFVDGYTPASGDTFTVLTAGSIDNQFNVTPPNMTATYGPVFITLTQD